MKFLEKDLEEIIYTADRAELSKRGLDITGKLYRQVNLGMFGIADLISVEKIPRGCAGNKQGELWINIYELKKEKVGISAFLQALGYVKGVAKFFYDRGFLFEVRINIVLIGRTMDDKSTFCYLSEFIGSGDGGYENKLSVYTYKYGLNGLTFNNQNDNMYVVAEEGFKS